MGESLEGQNLHAVWEIDATLKTSINDGFAFVVQFSL